VVRVRLAAPIMTSVSARTVHGPAEEPFARDCRQRVHEAGRMQLRDSLDFLGKEPAVFDEIDHFFRCPRFGRR
jgi:hypothetical protein